ncbi:MAG: sensor histidine kinase [Ignavibacteria bacterium]|nr:sensor histidine kinase [Ignavibacteria bacterium]
MPTFRMYEFQKYIERSNIYIKLLIASVLISLVALTDHITSKDISFSIFYLIPIAFMAWYGGKLYAIIFAVAGAGLWLILDTEGFSEMKNLWFSFWSTVVRFGFFIIVSVLIVKLKSLKNNQEEIISRRTIELQNEIAEHKKSQDNLLLKSRQLRDLNKKLETIKEEQNTRVAREIHDELGQSLTAINLELMWVKKKHSNIPDIVNRMSALSAIVTDTISTVRKISSDLRPRLLDQLGLFAAIESLVKEFRKRTGVKINLTLPQTAPQLESSFTITVYRIFQEALTNIIRHSGCSEADVKILFADGDHFNMQISDNGRGFNFKETYSKTGSLGLIGMHERANIIDGVLSFESAPGKGTIIKLQVPVSKNLIKP